MDTKWKKSKYTIVWIGVITAIVACIVLVTALGMLNHIYDIRWVTFEFDDSEARTFFTSIMPQKIWSTVIPSGICTVAGLIVAMIFIGQRTPEGRLKLNKFDRLYSEFKLIMFACLVLVVMLTSSVWFELIKYSNWGESLLSFLSDKELERLDYIDGLQGYDEYSFMPDNTAALLLVIAFIIEFYIGITIILSMVKRMKDHSFARSFFVYDILAKTADNVRQSEKIDLVVLGILIACTLLSATVFGSAIVLLLLLIFVPKLLTQYKEIKKGVEEVKQGNVDYKIPITSKTDLGRLASSINDISDVTSIAVENELKHQKMKTDLISNVSHDLKTPLTSMISYLDLLKREGLDSENAEEYLRILDEKTMRLKILTEELFEAAKASSGEMPVNMAEIEVSALVSQAVAELEERLLMNNLDVIFTDKVEDAKVLADGQLLWRVVENLLVNVSKYALPGSRVYIDLDEDDESVVLEIKNMSKERLNISVDELMERFKRGDESRNTEGSGLGLAIARDLTGLIGGEFNIAIDGDLFKATVKLKKTK